jgi:MraZ protein
MFEVNSQFSSFRKSPVILIMGGNESARPADFLGEEPLFLGYYTGELKQNNRLTLPTGFRELISDGVYVTQGFDRNVLVLTKSTFEQLYQHITSLNIADPLARLFLRMFLGTANYMEVGRDGMLSIPEGLVRFANLTDQVVFVGQGDYIELWSTEQWEDQKVQLKDFQANAQRFSAFSITTR